MTNNLLQLKEWLIEKGITHVESTGVYWKPVFNILEDSVEVILVNARHIKNVPGRKTDVKDSEWLCKLLRNGLVTNGASLKGKGILFDSIDRKSKLSIRRIPCPMKISLSHCFLR
jgi:hypothetical protein